MDMASQFKSNSRDYKALHHLLIDRDHDAFVRADWGKISDCFLPSFSAWHAHFSTDPMQWDNDFLVLSAYKKYWLKLAKEAQQANYNEPLFEALARITRLPRIKLQKNRAIVWKRFDGHIAKRQGAVDTLKWQTIYCCRCTQGQWKISGFLGYLPL